MTEDEWLTCEDTKAMVEYLRGGLRHRYRRLRLFSCAMCRHYQGLIQNERIRHALERAERLAEGELSEHTIEKWFREVRKITDAHPKRSDEGINRAVEWACLPSRYSGYSGSWSALAWNFRHMQKDNRRAEEVEQLARILLRDIFANPFRPSPPLQVDILAWNNRTVPKVAEGIYAERAFDRMPILHDALLDAGCNDEALLSHCRNPDGHVLGCWALDQILEKT